MADTSMDRVTAQFPELQPVFAIVSRLTRDKGRYAFHAYLTEVYRVVWHWSRKRIRKRQTKRLTSR
jgi:hypothetical protein